MVKQVDIDPETHKDCSDIKLVTSGWPATPYWWTPACDRTNKDIETIEEVWFELLSAVENLDDLREPYVVREVGEHSEILMDESMSVQDPDHIWFEYYFHEEFDDFNGKPCYLLGKVILHIIAVLNLKWIHLFREESWEKDQDVIDDDVTWDEFKHDNPDHLTSWENRHNLDTPDRRVEFYQSEMTRLGL